MSKKFRYPDQMSNTSEIITEEETIMEPEVVLELPKLDFSHWFDRKVKAGKIRVHQRDSLLVFLKKQGLSELEAVSVYDKAFLKF